jgi:hypothetical protein
MCRASAEEWYTRGIEASKQYRLPDVDGRAKEAPEATCLVAILHSNRSLQAIRMQKTYEVVCQAHLVDMQKEGRNERLHHCTSM